MPAIEHPQDLHPELKAALALHKDSTAEVKRAVHDALRPLMQACSRTEQHLNNLEQAVMEAELAIHDHALDSKMEFFNARVRATREAARSFREAGRAVALKVVELEQAFDEYHQRVALAGPSFSPSAVGRTDTESDDSPTG